MASPMLATKGPGGVTAGPFVRLDDYPQSNSPGFPRLCRTSSQWLELRPLLKGLALVLIHDDLLLLLTETAGILAL